MVMSPREMDRKIDEHFGYEANDDVEGVVATLAPNATHDIVGYPTGPTVGRERAREFYRRMFADLAESRVTPLRRLYGDNFMVDESEWEGRAPGSPFGLEGRDRPLKFRILHVLEFTPDGGQIQREQVWIDMAAVIRQLPQEERA
ncbi:MAG: nuclear transport factor 2 family protein [Phycisphaeraceae bacterium]|nr:MAG: nuclear transport factor 2 family protein [Phycisphaeraceae bacterium]